MPNKENISEELSLISAVVAGISRVSPYEAPQGYFDELPGRVLGAISLRNPEKPIPNPYSVPAGYFAGFAEQLMDRIKSAQVGEADRELAMISPLLNSIDKKTPFRAPDGYFGHLAENIISGVQAIELVNDELENLSPLMMSLQPIRVYEAPEGYFELFPATVLEMVTVSGTEKASEKTEATVISIGRGRKMLKYLSAAVVAGLILTAGWFRFYQSGQTVTAGTMDVAGNLSKASDQEIQNYLDNQNTPLAEVLSNSNATATLDINDVDVKNILVDVSDDELRQYLDDNDGTKDPVTN
jgi:hypothetical protein